MNRENYLDIAKGIAILLVVLGHELSWNDSLRYAIYSFHIPMFFILSGMVEGNKYVYGGGEKSFVLCVKNNAKSILRPYVIFSFAYIVYDVIKNILVESSIKIILLDILLTISGYGINVLWFLSALFGGKILLYWIFRMTLYKKSRMILLIPVVSGLGILIILLVRGLQDYCVGGAVLKRITYYFTVGILRPLVIIPFLLGGFLINKIIPLIKRKPWIQRLFSCMIFLTIVPAMYKWKMTLIVLYSRPVCGIYIFGTLFTLSMISISIFVDSLPYLRAWFAFWGRNSLFIMLTHEYFPIRQGIQRVMSLILDNYVAIIMMTFISVLIIEYILLKILIKPYAIIVLGKFEKRTIMKQKKAIFK